jgi:hypothetical protein
MTGQSSDDQYVAIVSGGHGMSPRELICWYEMILRLADWPPAAGLSPDRPGTPGWPDGVVVFSASTSEHTWLLRRTGGRGVDLRPCVITHRWRRRRRHD